MKPRFCSKHTSAKEKRIKKIRSKIKALGSSFGKEVYRLTVNKTPRHIYAQVFTHDGSKVLASASSLEQEVKTSKPKEGGKIAVANLVGKRIATKIKDLGLSNLAFDRSGFKYHGRIKALAEAIREEGINC